MEIFKPQDPIPATRSLVFEIKGIEAGTGKESKSNIITGYASTFGDMDRSGDVMVKGCFKKSIKRTGGKWPVKLEHKSVIGLNRTAREDDEGLYVKSILFAEEDDLPAAKEAMALVKNCEKFGHKLGLSVGGLIKEASPVYKENTMMWEIREFEILEHSITGTPANPNASLKSISDVLTGKYEAVRHKKHFLFDLKKKFDKEVAETEKLL